MRKKKEKKKIKNRDRKRERCVEKREREGVLERGKNGKENKKGTYVRGHRMNSIKTSLCVQQQQQQYHIISSKQAAV